MPTPINVNDIVEVKFHSWTPNQLSINVCHYLVNAITGTPAYEDVMNAMGLVVGPLYRNFMEDSALYIGLTWRFRRAGLWSPVQINTGGAGTGLVTDQLLPLQVSGIITKRTALAGRANRGRLYPGFFAENENDADGHPTLGAQTAMAGLAAQILTTQTYIGALGTNAEFQPVIFHRVGATVTAITGYTVRPKWAGQHRRGDYGKLNPRPF